MNILHPVKVKGKANETEKVFQFVIEYRGTESLIWIPKKLAIYRYGALLLPGWFLVERGFSLPPVLKVPEMVPDMDHPFFRQPLDIFSGNSLNPFFPVKICVHCVPLSDPIL